MGGIRAALGGISTAVAVTVGGILAAAIIAGVVILLLTATSGATGNMQIQRDKNSGANREQWNTTINNLYQQVLVDEANVKSDQAIVDGPGATKQDRINLQGVTQNCRTDVGAFNADMNNILVNSIPAGIPSSIDLTVCGG